MFSGKLLEAATLKHDKGILLHIRGKDCVALEVRYHKVCYKDDCKILWKTLMKVQSTTTER